MTDYQERKILFMSQTEPVSEQQFRIEKFSKQNLVL